MAPSRCAPRAIWKASRISPATWLARDEHCLPHARLRACPGGAHDGGLVVAAAEMQVVLDPRRR
jgi:hypothetical protein